ncbi:hypothetical protein L6164_007002 [Bauhinia variegata]|uniref:Uncharacterized protein n=1 Tax=Bauhinia variegata TaxID=167791 RepID=A0ACB9PVK5_BAUVA|nr:hypothetical protein L6164_007002 [Bauhinia variegata]
MDIRIFFTIIYTFTISLPPVVVGVATGAFLFSADLVRKINLPIPIDFVRAESYGSGTESNGAPTISFYLKVDVKNRHVILVEDIVDKGHTLSCVIAHLKSKGGFYPFIPSTNVTLALFLIKCPNHFVVGYGMDFAELYRNLPYVGVLKPEHYYTA